MVREAKLAVRGLWQGSRLVRLAALAMALTTILLLQPATTQAQKLMRLTRGGINYEQTAPGAHTLKVVKWSSQRYSGHIVLPPAILVDSINYIVTEVAPNAFVGCAGVKSVEMAPSLVVIGDGAFKGCKNLGRLLLNNALTTIGAHSFQGCEGLTHLLIPPSVAYIGQGAFEGCFNLLNVVLPAGEPKEMAPDNDQIVRAPNVFSADRRLTPSFVNAQNIITITNQANEFAFGERPDLRWQLNLPEPYWAPTAPGDSFLIEPPTLNNLAWGIHNNGSAHFNISGSGLQYYSYDVPFAYSIVKPEDGDEQTIDALTTGAGRFDLGEEDYTYAAVSNPTRNYQELPSALALANDEEEDEMSHADSLVFLLSYAPQVFDPNQKLIIPVPGLTPLHKEQPYEELDFSYSYNNKSSVEPNFTEQPPGKNKYSPRSLSHRPQGSLTGKNSGYRATSPYEPPNIACRKAPTNRNVYQAGGWKKLKLFGKKVKHFFARHFHPRHKARLPLSKHKGYRHKKHRRR